MAESVLRHDAPSHLEAAKQGEQSLLESDSRTLKDHSDNDGGLQLVGNTVVAHRAPKAALSWDFGIEDHPERNGIQAGGSVNLCSFTGTIRFYILNSTKNKPRTQLTGKQNSSKAGLTNVMY